MHVEWTEQPGHQVITCSDCRTSKFVEPGQWACMAMNVCCLTCAADFLVDNGLRRCMVCASVGAVVDVVTKE